jgi:hypothetical protein
MAFDPVRGRILLTGGLPTTPPSLGFRDAWEWDGVFWQQLPAVANRRVAWAHQVATDFGGGRVLFMDPNGGLLSAWDGSTWQALGSVQPSYQSGIASSAAWDERRRKLVIQLYGFSTTFPPPLWIPTTTWYWYLYEWDGTFQLISSMPGGAQLGNAQPMYFDAERQRVGVVDLPSLVSPLNTWEWSGAWYLAGQQALIWEPLVAYDHVNATPVIYEMAQPTRFFRLVSSTPATAASTGSGCAGSLGIPVLAAAPYSRPWVGDDFAVRMSNVPAGSFPFAVVGLATANTGLGGFGMPGCQLLATPDVVAPMQPAPGQEATWTMHVPAAPALAGATLHLQGALLSAGGAGPFGGAVSQRLTATAGVR